MSGTEPASSRDAPPSAARVCGCSARVGGEALQIAPRTLTALEAGGAHVGLGELADARTSSPRELLRARLLSFELYA